MDSQSSNKRNNSSLDGDNESRSFNEEIILTMDTAALREFAMKAAKRAEEETKRRKLAEEESRAKSQHIEEETKRRKLAEEESRAKSQHIEEEAKRREVSEKLRLGTFYATFDEVWGPRASRFGSCHYIAMTRTKPPDYTKSLFAKTLENARNSALEAANFTSSSRTSILGETKRKIWPVDVFESQFHDQSDSSKFLVPPGTGCPEDSDQVQQGSNHHTLPARPSKAPIAHLIPAAPQNASLYHNVAVWVFGLDESSRHAPVVQKLIHGSKKTGERQSRNEGAMESPHKTEKRVCLTGLKHMVCNKIRLANQFEHFDLHPRLLIVPILTLEQTKEWNGEGYHAIIMTSTGTKDDPENLQNVVDDIHMTNLGNLANVHETKCARSLLKATLQGLAYAFHKKSDESQPWVSSLESTSRSKLRDLRNTFTTIDGMETIMVPEMRQGELKPVRKITFAPASGERTSVGHPAPDPLLLAVKAAVNWSAFHEQKLMAAGERDESVSDRSEEAMNEFIATNDSYELAQRHKTIMNMEIAVSPSPSSQLLQKGTVTTQLHSVAPRKMKKSGFIEMQRASTNVISPPSNETTQEEDYTIEVQCASANVISPPSNDTTKQDAYTKNIHCCPPRR